MKNLLIILSFITLISACKKDKMCNQIQGTYKLTEYKNDVSTNIYTVPDTGQDIHTYPLAFMAAIIIIDESHNYIYYQGDRGHVTQTTGTFNCDLVFEITSYSYKYGDSRQYYKYTKI